MEFVKLSAPSLKELFIKEFEMMILSGRLKVGEKLPSERDLAKSMQVSRGVVNAGLSELARKGFLQVKPRSGVHVADYRRYGTADTLLSIMNYNGGRLRREEIRSILEMKVVLDKLAAELAIPILTEVDIAALDGRFGALGKDLSLEEAAEAAFEFYHELAMISGNTLLPLIYRSFRAPVRHLWMRFIRKYGQETIRVDAARILDALKARDAAAAAAAVEQAVSGSISGAREIYED